MGSRYPISPFQGLNPKWASEPSSGRFVSSVLHGSSCSDGRDEGGGEDKGKGKCFSCSCDHMYEDSGGYETIVPSNWKNIAIGIAITYFDTLIIMHQFSFLCTNSCGKSPSIF